MDSERSARRKSIRAARDWLMGAEDALAGQDDLAGDLKLMLARAELERASVFCRARMQRWSRRLLPPLVAMAAVLAAVSWQRAPVQEAHTVQESQMAQGAENGVLHASAEPAAPIAEEPSAMGSGETTKPMDFAAPLRAEQPVQEAPAAAAVPQAAPAPPVRAAQPSPMPDRDMQRLMQVGGKILRE